MTHYLNLREQPFSMIANFAPHFDGNGDGKCDEDSCGYDMSE